MDRRRAAGALLALAACACIATTAAAPTTNQTALDLYEEPTDGCYYNFQHYGEGDRIMTNEPCLNCTCHNRMLMCYLRVCPFTKAIGQDCTVEKRADQCCPIVTCPDVPVDLLTSTSTTSPGEYGGTGVGKVDQYGCSINGQYFSEGAKVPPTPGKPCEHCYCIRNMTTCVMQECTLHVDGCTPIYHKDVCCPVRYFCDHPEDEIPLLDDMTTTVRPTPGFLLTTSAPVENLTTTTTPPARRDCIEDDQLYPDGALIKTEKPCEHCYCMKGDIVCVVQECGTPMENEGKSCTSLPPREGQCCPDTYICEGDEVSTEILVPDEHSEDLSTTIVPPRRVSIEGSGYRNEDEISYTETPMFSSELEGSGEEELGEKLEKDTTDKLTDRYGPTEEPEFISQTPLVPMSEEAEKATTEPDKGLNTVPSGIHDEEITDISIQKHTTPSDELTFTKPSRRNEQEPSPTPESEQTTEPTVYEKTTLLPEIKATEPSILKEKTTVASNESETSSPEIVVNETKIKQEDATESSMINELETHIPLIESEEDKVTDSTVTSESNTHIPFSIEESKATESLMLTEEEKSTELPMVIEPETKFPIKPEEETVTEILMTDKPSNTDDTKLTGMPSLSEEEKISIEEVNVSSEPVPTQTTKDESIITVSPSSIKEDEEVPADARRTSTYDTFTTRIVTETSTIPQEGIDITESVISEYNTVPYTDEELTSEKSPEQDNSKVTELPKTTEQEAQPAKPSDEKKYTTTTVTNDIATTTVSVKAEDVPVQYHTTDVSSEAGSAPTTEFAFKKEEEETTTSENATPQNVETFTNASVVISGEAFTPAGVIEQESGSTETPENEFEKETTHLKETTTESVIEISTYTHVSEKEFVSTMVPESVTSPVVASTPKIDISESTVINPIDNEIAEVPSPGRIPGEGDCLLEGKTYKNESVVPSMNKCHSGCKCISSIIKCDPIICSAPPEDMENCQPRYDTPESCCPTYVCDHGMETIPPQPQSHVTGTETPTPSTIECNGDDECKQMGENIPSTEQSDENKTSDCGSSSCVQEQHTPAAVCTDSQCQLLSPEKPLLPPVEVPSQETPTADVHKTCINPEDCKETKVPASCHDESCSTAQGDVCGQEGGCKTESEKLPSKDSSQKCDIEGECKQVYIQLPETAPCKGESCKEVQQDCSTGECKIIYQSPQPSQGEICSEENGCQTPQDVQKCENGKCETTESSDRTGVECSGNDCEQQQPIPPAQDMTHIIPISTESPTDEQSTPKQYTEEKETQPALSNLPTSVSEEEVTSKPSEIKPDNDVKVQEPPTLDEEEKVTTFSEETTTLYTSEMTSEQSTNKPKDFDDKVIEISPEESFTTESQVTKTLQEHTTEIIKLPETEKPEPTPTAVSPQINVEIQPAEQETEGPEISESSEVATDSKIDASTEMSLEHKTKQPELHETDKESTEKPIKGVVLLDDTTVDQQYFVTERETLKPIEGLDKVSTVTPSPEIVTQKEISFETTEKKSETDVITTETVPLEFDETVTEKSEFSTIMEEFETKPELPTESPIVQEKEMTTPSYDKETISNENVQTVPVKDTDSVTTAIPQRSGVDKEETSTPLLSIDKKPETTEAGLKEFATEPPVQPTLFDEHLPTQHIPEDQEETVTNESESTISPIMDTDNEEKPTTKQSVDIAEENGTETPLSLVTKQSTMAAPVTESDEISTKVPEVHITIPQIYEAADEIKTESAEPIEPHKTITELPFSTPSESEITEQPKITEYEYTPKESTIAPEQERPSTDQQKPISEEQLLTATNSEKPLEASTKTPETAEPSTDEKATESSIETKQENTTTELSEQPPIVKEEEKTTESLRQPITEEYEISTDEPTKPSKDEMSTIIPEFASTQPQALETIQPELYIPKITTALPEKSEEMESTENTVSEEISKPPDSTEKTNSQAEQTESITESQEVHDSISEEKISTDMPVTEHEITTISREPDITLVTESPETQETIAQDLVKQESETTISPQLPDIEHPSVEDVPQTVSEDQAIEKEGKPVTDTPIEEERTESSIIKETTAASVREPARPEMSEASTLSPQLHEINTEQPDLVVTEPQDSSTTVLFKKTTTTEPEDSHKEEHKPTQSMLEEMPDTTGIPVEASTESPVLENTKEKLPEESLQTVRPQVDQSKTTPYLVELEEHTHKLDEVEPTVASFDETPSATSEESMSGPSEETVAKPSKEPIAGTPEEYSFIPSEEPTDGPLGKPTFDTSEEPTTVRPELQETEPHSIEIVTEKLESEGQQTSIPEVETERPADHNEPSVLTEESHTTASLEEKPSTPVTTDESALVHKYGAPEDQDEQKVSATTAKQADDENVTQVTILEEPFEEKVTEKPVDRTGPEEEFIPVTVKDDTAKPVEESITAEPEKAATTAKAPEDEIITPSTQDEATTTEPKETTTTPRSKETSATAEPEEAATTTKPEGLAIAFKPEDVATTAKTEEVFTTAKSDETATTAKSEEAATTVKFEDEPTLQHEQSKPEEKPSDLPQATAVPEIPKPDEMQPTDDIPSPEDDSQFPSSGGYNQEPDYVEEDQAFGPGTCRYGGKVYVSAQQIPRDDPCDFCFCFRSDIICLQQSCPPPIHGCHEEPIQGFCCPRYECPVSMATTLNVTTTTTTTTTTLPPHFLPHAYKGAAQRKGCQIKGHTYQVGEVVRASSGPCLHCTCGGDGKMKCDPKQCTPEPMLRQMIAAAVSTKRRR